MNTKCTNNVQFFVWNKLKIQMQMQLLELLTARGNSSLGHFYFKTRRRSNFSNLLEHFQYVHNNNERHSTCDFKILAAKQLMFNTNRIIVLTRSTFAQCILQTPWKFWISSGFSRSICHTSFNSKLKQLHWELQYGHFL